MADELVNAMVAEGATCNEAIRSLLWECVCVEVG